MSLKNIDMQIAVQRANQASKVQEHLNREAQLMNMHAAQTVQKQEEQKIKTVLRREETGKLSLRTDEEGRNAFKRKQDRRKQTKNEKKSPHPYKGKFVDTSG